MTKEPIPVPATRRSERSSRFQGTFFERKQHRKNKKNFQTVPNPAEIPKTVPNPTETVPNHVETAPTSDILQQVLFSDQVKFIWNSFYIIFKENPELLQQFASCVENMKLAVNKKFPDFVQEGIKLIDSSDEHPYVKEFFMIVFNALKQDSNETDQAEIVTIPDEEEPKKPEDPEESIHNFYPVKNKDGLLVLLPKPPVANRTEMPPPVVVVVD